MPTKPIPFVQLSGVSYTYEDSDSPTLEQISLDVQAGEWLTIIGASGSGKSTLCRIMNGQLPRIAGGQRKGNVRIDDMDPGSAEPGLLASHMGSLGQDPDAELVVGTVEDEIAFGPENLRIPAEEIGRRIDQWTEALNLQPIRHEYIHQLSGGQRQRTALASVMSLQPQLLILDEPAASLDPAGKQDLLHIIEHWHRAGGTLITASARWDETVMKCSRVVILAKGRIVLEGTPAELLLHHRERLEQLYILPPDINQAADQKAAIQPAGEHANTDTYADTYVHEATDLSASIASAGMQEDKSELRRSEGNAAVPSVSGQPVVEVRDLTYSYSSALRPALANVQFALYPGEMVMLCGVNGSGKTTLTRLLSGLLQPPVQSIYRKGKDTARQSIYDRAADTGYVFQHPDHQWVAATVWEECVYGIRAHLNLRPRDRLPDSYEKEAEDMLRFAGLLERRDDSPYSLAGGQKRLLAAVSQFLLPRPLYILDEPGSAADYFTIDRLLYLCRRAVSQGAALLIVTHEPELFAAPEVRKLTLEQGRLIEDTYSSSR
ncbi:ABC transporter ATP-binding protein [Paenibacillus shenyangensis]|uniref:ABC transporter ATP-binding protein n=1 Tax=Paenibacillus sp. A9 TaxID=1284352 RepID=UPI00035EBB5D|nr:ABC transporter ATP-binding protein [Paenibacillus sp. A9]